MGQPWKESAGGGWEGTECSHWKRADGQLMRMGDLKKRSSKTGVLALLGLELLEVGNSPRVRGCCLQTSALLTEKGYGEGKMPNHNTGGKRRNHRIG